MANPVSVRLQYTVKIIYIFKCAKTEPMTMDLERRKLDLITARIRRMGEGDSFSLSGQERGGGTSR